MTNASPSRGIEVLLPGRAAGGRGDARSLGGLTWARNRGNTWGNWTGTGHRTGRWSSPAGQGAQDLVYVLDGEREVSLGGQEPHARAWEHRRLMAAVLRRDHEVVLAVP